MHRIIPDFIIDNYRAGQRDGTFPAAGLFADLSGFSTITDALMRDREHGAEQLSALMYSVFEPVVQAIFEHGGIITGFAGDALTAVYPADEDLGGAACEALASAWAIRQRLASIASLDTAYGVFPISVKVGIGCGTASWLITESPDRRRATYYFRGSAIEEPAEAEHHAKPGGIVLAQSVNALLDDIAQAEMSGGLASIVGVRGTLPGPRPIAQQPVDLEAARVFAPDVLLAEGLRGEFRQVVSVFLRLPPLPDDRLERFLTCVFDLQERYAGLIRRLDFGDKDCNLLILWGAPTAYENDISRALNFTLDLQSRLDFPIAAGVTFQMAHAGYIGSRLFEEYGCSGWGVNLAARLMMSAAPGEVWLDERVVQRITRTFEVEPLGEMRFKGFAQQQRVHLLKGRKTEAEALYAGALAGREAEMRRLAEYVEPLWEGRSAGVTLVTGEAGVGKSRLVREFRAAASMAQREVLWAFCPADQTVRQSFNPFRYWLVRYFDMVAAPDDAARLGSLRSRLDDLVSDISDEALIDDLRRASSFLAALFDLRWADSPYERMDAQARYDNTLLALVALIKAESLRQPLVLLVEDAHELDEDSKVLLSRLKRILSVSVSHPVAILMTARAEVGGLLVEDGFADRVIELGGLSAEAMVALSNDILGRPAAAELIRFVEARAEGNPFFAEQILQYLREEGLLQLSPAGNWTVKPGWHASILPMDITAMLIARLDQLTHQVKDVVQTASVLGREFELQVLARMLEDDPTLDDKVADATRSSIWSPISQLRYIFRHSLLRDAAYGMQLLAHRRELHGVALEAIESLYGDELRNHYPELAYHAEQAVHAEKARRYLRSAADAARDAYQNAQALDYYTRALSFVPIGDAQTRFELLQERVLLNRRLGERSAEAADLDALDELADALGDMGSKACAGMLRAKYMLNLGDFQRAADHAMQAAEAAWTAGDVGLGLGTQLILPEASLRLGRFDEAMHEAEQALRLAQHHDRPAEAGAALNLMGLITLEQKSGALARVFLEATLEIARYSADGALEWKSLNNLGNAAGFVDGDYAGARGFYEQASVIVHERGDRPAECIVLANLGWAAGMQGDLQNALAYQQRALAIAREVGDPYQEAYTLINLSALAGIQGNAAPACQYAVDAEALTTRIGDRSGLAWALLYKGYAYLLESSLGQAEEAFQRSAGIREELHQPGLGTEPLAGLIQVALERNNLDAARQMAERILAHLESGATLEGTEEPLRVYFACYRVLEAAGDPRSDVVLNIARKMLSVQLAKFKDDEARSMYVENVPWRLAVLKASDARGTA